MNSSRRPTWSVASVGLLIVPCPGFPIEFHEDQSPSGRFCQACHTVMPVFRTAASRRPSGLCATVIPLRWLPLPGSPDDRQRSTHLSWST